MSGIEWPEMPKAMAPPRRRHELTIKIGANSHQDLVDALDNVLFDLHRHDGEGPINITSGGPSAGYTVERTVDASVTRESFRADVQRWLAQLSQNAEPKGGEHECG